MTPPLVDVNIAVYNHAAFLRQTIEGVLSQQTNFPFRLLVGDDCSTDGSIEILKEYEKKYPEKFLIIYQPKNLGLGAAERNGTILLKHSTAKYIALLDGDDYWINSSKLQKQVDFLEANQDYSICFHSVYELWDNKKKILSTLNPLEGEHTYTIEDLSKRNFIHTPSVVFRNRLEELPNWFNQAGVGDYVLHMLNARHGKIKYFPEPMAVYRRHTGGYWSAAKDRNRLHAWVKVLDYLLTEDFSHPAIVNLNDQKRNILKEYFFCLLNEDDYQTFSSELERYCQQDNEIRGKWTEDFFIEYINRLKSTRAYKLGQRLALIKRKIGRIFKF